MEPTIEPGSQEPVQPLAAPPPAPAPELPRAAVTVLEGKTTRELELEARLAEKDKTLRDREMSINDLQDQNRQLKQVIPPTPRKKKSVMEAFFDGGA
jgi:hypothetical protein